jgi:site-specific recombinase XerD
MKLHSAVTQYGIYRRSLGEKYTSNEAHLKAFARAIGPNKNILNIQPKQVDRFLAGKGPITSNWHHKHSALRGFYHYIISRGYAKTSPLPMVIPKKPQDFVPYIYTVKELRALFEASMSYQKRCAFLESFMVRTLLLLLYGAGLRISEAINLTLADVDLPHSLLTIRETKFYKTRLIPLGTQLTQFLSQYAILRQQEGYSQNLEAPFFIGRNGKAIVQHTFQEAFRKIRRKAGVQRADNSRQQPRLHDLRHTFAVHRLTAWYKEGADVQKWLPVLSVYLGHGKLSSTSIYLTMTPALLEEAGKLFQRYVFTEVTNE